MTPRLKVLLVENDPDDSALCLRALGKAGLALDTDVVATRAEFEHAIDRQPYDLVLSDYDLGTWTGLDAYERLRHKGKSTPVILVTDTLGEEAAVDCIKQGISDYVLKDNLTRLPVAITRALEEQALRLQRQTAEEHTRAALAKFQTLLEAAPDAILGIDREGTIVLVNAQTEQIFGFMREELLGQPVEQLMPERFRTQHRIYRTGSLENPHSRLMGQTLGLCGRRKDGSEFPVEVSLSPVGGEKDIAALAIVRDLSDRRLLEDQVRQSQKMDAIGRLAGGLAHDFNNLLMVIHGYLELLREELPEGTSMREHVYEITHAAERAAGLTSQLLTFSRRQMSAPRALNINDVINGFTKMLPRLVGENVRLNSVLAPEKVRVKIDPGQIEQVLLNLAINARDAMPRGGRLTIETSQLELDPAFVRRHVGSRGGSFILLSVGDTGIGMDEETRSRVFEPFFTTKEVGKGTGLGLSTVYGIVTQNQGFIRVDSVPGEGATFRLYFPRADGDELIEEPIDPAASTPGGSETILVAEDEMGVAKLMAEFLRSLGYTVLEAQDGRTAFKTAERYFGKIDLLLTDVVMPGMAGRELATRLLARQPDTKVLYMSGYGEDIVVGNLLSKDTALLKKPFSLASLARSVRRALGQEGATS